MIDISISLQLDSISHIPFEMYQKDFTFIVNNEQFQTSQLAADLLSPKISRLRLSDPTIKEYYILTQAKGNFQHFLDILSFRQQTITESEISFISEIIGELETKINIKNNKQIQLTNDNIIHQILSHDKSQQLYFTALSNEIEYVSEHFYLLQKQFSSQLLKLSHKTIEKILINSKLRVENEDQVLNFVNELYLKDSANSDFYDYVLFSNVDEKSITEFIQIFDKDDMTSETWRGISERLKKSTKSSEDDDAHKERYMKETENLKKQNKKGQIFPFKNKEFDGIFKHLQSNSKIYNEVNISFSSKESYSGDPKVLFMYDNLGNYFLSKNEPNSWICFEFKNHQVILDAYTIRSERSNRTGGNHLKSWVIEGSNDNAGNWTKIDEEMDNASLNGSNYVHTFQIKNQRRQEYKYIRLKMTNSNWKNDYFLLFNSIEFYGQLI